METRPYVKRVKITNRALEQYRAFDRGARAGALSRSLTGQKLAPCGGSLLCCSIGYARFVFRKVTAGKNGRGGTNSYVLVGVYPDGVLGSDAG